MAACAPPASSPDPILVVGWGAPPPSCAEESDSLDAKMGITGPGPQSIPCTCSALRPPWHGTRPLSRRRFMEKPVEQEIHSKKALATCVLIPCMVS